MPGSEFPPVPPPPAPSFLLRSRPWTQSARPAWVLHPHRPALPRPTTLYIGERGCHLTAKSPRVGSQCYGSLGERKGQSGFLNRDEAEWAHWTERLNHEGNATEKWHSPPPTRARGFCVCSLLVGAVPGAGPRETPPNGLLQSARARLPGEVPDLDSLRLGPAAPLGCGSALQPPAPRCALEAGRKEKGGRKRREEEKRQLTHAFQSFHSEQPGVLLPPLLSLLLSRPPLLPPEETYWTLRALLPPLEIPS